MHTDEQLKEMHKLQGKLTNTITLKRSTQNQANCLGEVASVNNAKTTSALQAFSSVTAKHAINQTSSFNKSSTSRPRDSAKVANFTMKLYDV